MTSISRCPDHLMGSTIWYVVPPEVTDAGDVFPPMAMVMG
jgi:hypothetical protein